MGQRLFRLVDVRLPLYEVHHSAELRLGADRDLNRHGIRPKPAVDGLDSVIEVRPQPVHLVDKYQSRHFVAIGLPPHRLRLWLDAGHRFENHDTAIENPQAAFHFGSEVDVAGRVYDVDPVAIPLCGRGGGTDSDSAFTLQVHEIHDRRAFVDVADLVRLAGEEEHAFRDGGLPSVNMCNKADIPDLLQVRPAWLLRHCRSHSYWLIAWLMRAWRQYPLIIVRD